MSEGEAATRDRVKLDDSWKNVLIDEFDQQYMVALREFLLEQKQVRKVIYPRGEDIFAALDLTPLEGTKIVIIGQDPYHGPRQAHGLCFSVQSGVQLPPSLVNIFTEIEQDMRD
ncbi:MAG: uracil-DNA glycosylase, partial [Pseudomonadales bacterium]